jgi:DNA primase
MSAYDPGLIAQIKARLRIEDVIGRHVELRPAGTRLVAPCPFHQETKPSFSVNPEGGFYYCFGCQASGDIIEFYRAINGLEFGEAVEALAREAGLDVRSRPEYRAPGEISRSQCLDMHAQAAVFYRQMLSRGPGQVARDYIARRGLAGGIVERFCLGWAPAGWNDLRDHLRRGGFADDAMEKAGLVSKSAKGTYYDRFRERLIFPIMNLSAQTVAFGGRSLTDGDGPKYLNSSETPIYTKGEHLYGLYQARRAMSHTKNVLLTEGYVDVLSLHQFGFENSCGVLGTALTPEQVHRLSGLVGQVDLVFDGDNAGRKAALRSAEMILTQGLKCRVLCMPEGEDVDSVLQKFGSEQLQSLIDSSVEGLQYCLQRVKTTMSPKDILRWASEFSRKLNTPDLQAYYLPKLSAGLGLSEAEWRQVLPDQSVKNGLQATNRHKVSASQDDKVFLAFAVRFPEYHEAMQQLGIKDVLATSRGKSFWNKIFRADPDVILNSLDHGEKKFYIECQMRADCTQDDARTEWPDIEFWIKHKLSNSSSLTEKLRNARDRKDFGEELRLLALIQAQKKE